MKSFVIFSFLLITEVRNSLCHFLPIGESGIDTAEEQTYPDPRTTQIDELQTRGLNTDKPNSREQVNEMMKKAAKDKEDALKDIRLGYNAFEAERQRMLEEVYKKQQEEIRIIEQDHMIEDILAAEIRKHDLQKWQNKWQNNEKKYQQTYALIHERKRKIMQARETTQQAANEQLIKSYNVAREHWERITIENAMVLEKCQDAYESAKKSAEKIRTQAEMEFWKAAAKFDKIPFLEWTEITNNYNAQMAMYEKAIEEADKAVENVFQNFGIGKKFEEAVKIAVTEFVNTFKEGDSVALAELGSCNKQLSEAQKSKVDVRELINDGIQKVEIEFKDSVVSAKNEAQKQYAIIFKKWNTKRAVIELHLKKRKDEFLKAQDKVFKSYDEVMTKLLKYTFV